VTLLRSRSALAAATAALALPLTACGAADAGSSSGSASEPPAATASSAMESSAMESSAMESSATEEAMAEPDSEELFGEGCTAVPTEGEGSPEGMTDDPVATAASNNPALSTLVEAVTAADLVDALNSAEDITVLAPANPAFEAIPADALDALLDDNAQLSAVLTHHVIDGRLAPDRLAGEHTTLNGDTVTVEGSGEEFTVAAEGTVLGKADGTVICGNVQTANATVYVIDQVLSPPAA
jgi:uncharacterized surface protein with fasciclin (FAS1) repeats